jgi:hypothetical protein
MIHFSFLEDVTSFGDDSGGSDDFLNNTFSSDQPPINPDNSFSEPSDPGENPWYSNA